MAWFERDFEGYAQFRETGGTWRFYVSGFETHGVKDQCSVLRSDRTYESVHIDDKNRILIKGKRYGQTKWSH
jgi:hypothetical protein